MLRLIKKTVAKDLNEFSKNSGIRMEIIERKNWKKLTNDISIHLMVSMSNFRFILKKNCSLIGKEIPVDCSRGRKNLLNCRLKKKK